MAWLASAAAARPLAARAQTSEPLRRVGVLMPYAANDLQARSGLAALRDGLRDLGWTEGRNLQLAVHLTAETAAVRANAATLVKSQPDVIFARSTISVAALMQETHTIPIVFALVSDPIASGFVASLARPGGNVTGFTNFAPSLISKWVEALKEIAPHVARIAILYNPDTAPGGGSYFLPPFEAAAASKGIKPTNVPVHDVDEIDRALAAFVREPGGGVIFMPDPFMLAHRERIVALAAGHRLPSAYVFRDFVVAGGLMSYGVNSRAVIRQAASYIDRILKGAKPADLPVQQPAVFEFVVNLKAAKALGLTVPPSLLARADEVIE